MTQELDLTQLREVAEQATPGPWAVYDRGIGYEVHDANGCELNGGMRETFTEADATHIATFDPPTVLSLIDRIETAEAELDEAVKHVARIQDDRRREGYVPVADYESRERQWRSYEAELKARAETAEQAVARVRAMAEEMGEGKAFGILTRGREDEYPISYFIEMLEEALDGEPS